MIQEFSNSYNSTAGQLREINENKSRAGKRYQSHNAQNMKEILMENLSPEIK